MISSLKTGKIILRLRDSRGLTQTALAELCGVSRVMIGKYERDESLPSIEAAKKIADALGVSIDRLVDEEAISVLDSQVMKRIEGICSLEDDRRKILFDLIDTYIREAKGRKVFA
ncbi:MAG: helix-turn-helix transcriptional regulator [Chryseotalea sp. WA131a]|nr:MAG: helix-turn-helix transcriptional regulator [Chryseotalea sp. WA131a]